MDKDTILKIKKLFALAEGSNFPAESANALGKAQALMLKHKVDQAMLEVIGEVEEEEIVTFKDSPLNEEDSGKSQKANWKVRLASVLCQFNGCYLFSSGINIILVGKPSDVDTIRYLYSYCVRQIDHLTSKHCRGQGRTYGNNFRYGCVDAVKKAMQDEQEAVRQQFGGVSERGLIVVDNTLLKIKEDIKKAERHAKGQFNLRSSSSSHRGNENARSAGREAGKGIYNGKGGTRLTAGQKRLG